MNYPTIKKNLMIYIIHRQLILIVQMQARSPDSSLKSHIEVITNQSNFINKITYSLRCILSSLDYYNSNRTANIAYVLRSCPIFIQALRNIRNPQMHYLTLKIFNVLIYYQQFTYDEQSLIMDALINVEAIDSNDHAHQLTHLFGRMHKTNKSPKMLIEFVIRFNLDPNEAHEIITSLHRQNRTYKDIQKYVKIGIKYIKSQKMTQSILQILYWLTYNSSIINIEGQMLIIINQSINHYPINLNIQYYSKLLFKICHGSINKSMNNLQVNEANMKDEMVQNFLKDLFGKRKPLFIPALRLLYKQQQLSAQIVSYLKKSQYFIIILDYVRTYGIQISNKQNQKESEEILLLRRAKGEKVILKQTKKIPLEYLSEINEIYSLIKQNQTLQNGLKILKIINNKIVSHPLFPSLLRITHIIFLRADENHRNNLKKIQKYITNQFTNQFLIKCLKENNNDYVIWSPLLLAGHQIGEYQQLISSYLNESVRSLSQRMYLGNWLIKERNLKLSKTFFHILLREISSESYDPVISRQIKKYLKQFQVSQSLKQFLITNYKEYLEKLFQILTSRLVIDEDGSIVDILFLLEKWGVYKGQWKLVYRWVFSSLESYQDQLSTHMADCLQIFEMIIDNVDKNSIPKLIIQRFMTIVRTNFSKYGNQCLFSLQRIFQMIFPQGFDCEYLQSPPSLNNIPQDIDLIQQQLIKVCKSCFFGMISHTQTINYIVSVLSLSKITQKTVIQCQQIIIWIFKYSQEEVPLKIVQIFVKYLQNVEFLKISQNCLQIIAEISNSYNLLKLPIYNLLTMFINDHTSISYINQIINTINQTQPKKLKQYQLAQYVQQSLIRLITMQNINLVEAYLQFLTILCQDNGVYADCLKKSTPILKRILVEEGAQNTLFRQALILFVIKTLTDYGEYFQTTVLWKILEKYSSFSSIVSVIVETLSLNANEDEILSVSQNILLNKIVLLYNDNDEINKKCNVIFQKMSPKIKNSQSPELEFMNEFKKKNYQYCEKLTHKIDSPYLIQLQDLSHFLSNGHQFTKLHRFLFQNPKTRATMLLSKQIYLHSSYIPYIIQINQQLQNKKNEVVNFVTNGNQAEFIQLNQQLLNQINKTLNNIDTKVVQNIVNACPNGQKHKILSFFSKITSTSSTALKIIEKLIDQQPQLYRVIVPFKSPNIQLIPQNCLINHVFSHIQNYTSKNSQYVLNVIKRMIGCKNLLSTELNSLYSIFTSIQITTFQKQHEMITKFLISQFNKIQAFNPIIIYGYLNVMINMNIHQNSIPIPTFTFNILRKNITTNLQRQSFLWILTAFSCSKKLTLSNLIQISQLIESLKVEQYDSQKLRTIQQNLKSVKNKLTIEEMNKVIEANKIMQAHKMISNSEENKIIQNNNSIVSVNNIVQNNDSIVSVKGAKMVVEFDNIDKLNEQDEGLKQVQKERHEDKQHNISSIKQHSKFLSQIIYKQRLLSTQEQQRVNKSIDALCETAQINKFYCKKINSLQVVHKLIKLNEKYNILDKIVHLLWIMSQKKQYTCLNLISEPIVIKVFKILLKKNLQQKISNEETLKIIKIVINCKNSHTNFFKEGLFSMLIQLGNSNIALQRILHMFISIQLTPNIINQIYQRNMLKNMMQSFQKNVVTSEDILSLWIRLGGKICINSSIQKKFMSENVHQQLLKKGQLIQVMKIRKNIMYFLGQLTKNNQKMGQWVMINKVTETAIKWLQNQPNDELYSFFYNFCLQNQIHLEYAYRINYHLIMIKNLKTKKSPKGAYFYKSLGQLMSNNKYVQLFLKEEVVKFLVYQYTINPQIAIYQTLLEFIYCLKDDKEFDEITKQKFWICLNLFYQKLRNQNVYPNILRIFLYMLSVNRIKDLIDPQIRSAIIKKASLSLNIQGKQLSLRFIANLSLALKQSFVTNDCIKILEVLLSCQIQLKQLSLTYDFLRLQNTHKDIAYLEQFGQNSIPSLIADRFSQYNTQQMNIAIDIFYILAFEKENAIVIGSKILTIILQVINNQKLRQKALKLIAQLLQWKKNLQIFTITSILKSLIAKMKICLQNQATGLLYSEIWIKLKTYKKQDGLINKSFEEIKRQITNLNSATKTNLLKAIDKGNFNNSKITIQMRNKCLQGVKVKMYKPDGKTSNLIMFITEDLMEINCATEITEQVKSKWRLPIDQIQSLISYQNYTVQFEHSQFYLSSIFSPPNKQVCLTIKGKPNTLNACFQNKATRDQWCGYLKIICEQTAKTVSLISNK